ncbi:hypothetical protein D3C87_2098100 [compost metagenome]
MPWQREMSGLPAPSLVVEADALDMNEFGLIGQQVLLGKVLGVLEQMAFDEIRGEVTQMVSAHAATEQSELF